MPAAEIGRRIEPPGAVAGVAVRPAGSGSSAPIRPAARGSQTTIERAGIRSALEQEVEADGRDAEHEQRRVVADEPARDRADGGRAGTDDPAGAAYQRLVDDAR